MSIAVNSGQSPQRSRENKRQHKCGSTEGYLKFRANKQLESPKKMAAKKKTSLQHQNETAKIS